MKNNFTHTEPVKAGLIFCNYRFRFEYYKHSLFNFNLTSRKIKTFSCVYMTEVQHSDFIIFKLKLTKKKIHFNGFDQSD